MIQTPVASLKPMVNHFAPHRPLPCRADRQKIIERAKLVLVEARATAERLDRSFDVISAEWSPDAQTLPPRPSLERGMFSEIKIVILDLRRAWRAASRR